MAKGLKCGSCGKGVMYGHNVSHAKNRTRRIFKPNLHKAKVLVNGVGKTMRLCTKCLRIFKGQSKKVQKEASVIPAEIVAPAVAVI